MRFFPEKISTFTPKISDDLFFSHRPLFTALNVVYDPFFTRKTTISDKNSLIRPCFLLCSYFRAHPTTLSTSLNIGGGPIHESSPTSNFWGTVPPVPPRSPTLPNSPFHILVSHFLTYYSSIFH